MKKFYYSLLLSILFASSAQAQYLKKANEFSPKDGQNEQFFAYDMNANQELNRLFVSAPKDNKEAVRSGAVYVFQASDRKQIIKIKSPEVRLNEAFGHSLSINQQELVVGAPGWSRFFRSEGRAYVFSQHLGGKENWGLICKLSPSESHPNDLFGYCVFIHKNYVFVGAPGHQRKGAVFVFKRKTSSSNTWEQIAKLTPDTNSEYFGAALSFDGEHLAIGAPRERDGSGALYIYEANNSASVWNLIKEVKPERRIYLGSKIQLKNGICAITCSDGVSGRVRIYEQNHGGTNNWGEIANLAPKRPDGIYDFGTGLHLYHDYLLVGAPSYDDYSGALYLYQRLNDGNWKKKYDSEYGFTARRKERIGYSAFIYDNNTVFFGGIADMYSSGKVMEFKANPAFTPNIVEKAKTINTNTSAQNNSNNSSSNNTSEVKETTKAPEQRVLDLASSAQLPTLEKGQKHIGAISIKNTGTHALDIQNIVSSSNIQVSVKNIHIAPKDEYKLSYTYTQSDNGNAYIEIVSNKTAGNNRIQLNAELKEAAIYKLDIDEHIEVSNAKLGEYTEVQISLWNRGNQDIHHIHFEMASNLELISAPKTIKAGNKALATFKLMPLVLGASKAKIHIETAMAILNKTISLSVQSILGGNEMMLKNKGLISVPGMMDKRLLLNFKFAQASKLRVLIKQMSGTEVERHEFSNDSKIHCLPVHQLKKGNYTISVINLQNNMPIGQALFRIE